MKICEVTVETSLQEGMNDIVNDLIAKFKAETNSKDVIDMRSPGSRTWTRGDGVRYRDPGRIKPYDENRTEEFENFWPWLIKQPGVKSIGKISGEFSSSSSNEAVSYKGLYFANTPYNTIEYGSVKRVANPNSVWRQQKETSNVIDEASYPGNIGLVEVLKFFVIAEKKNPKLANEVEKLIEQNNDKQAWKIIQEFLGIKLQGAQFESEEITELESPEALNDRLTKELKKLRIELTQAGYTSSDINTALNRSAVRLAKEKERKFGKFRSSIDQKPVVKKPTKVYHIENETSPPQLNVGDMVYVQDPGAHRAGAINKWNGPYKLIDIDNSRNGEKHGKYIVKMNTRDSRWPVAKKSTKAYNVENATAGATSAGNIASIANPHLSPGKARGNKSFTGTPGKSGTKSPPQPKVVQQKNPDGSIKGAHDVGGNLFGGGTIKRK